MSSCITSQRQYTRRTLSTFLDIIQRDVTRELDKYPSSQNLDTLPALSRQSLVVARSLHRRIEEMDSRNNCRQCWLHQEYCVCHACQPLPKLPSIRRIFVVLHHDEIGLSVDTAKLIGMAYPEQTRFIVGGLEDQQALREMEQAMKGKNCLVLFPTEDAKTFQALKHHTLDQVTTTSDDLDDHWDIIVLDGTWSQARRLHSRYVPKLKDGGPPRVQLSENAISILSSRSSNQGKMNEGHQLRPHPTFWRQVSTLEATRLLLGDMLGTEGNGGGSWDALKSYHKIGDLAAVKHLGPPRGGSKYSMSEQIDDSNSLPS